MKILFQGDSITDAGRDRQHPQYMGNGYVSEIAIRLKMAGKKHNIENTAIGGNRICDIYGRWIEDTLNHDFDVLSILCGINDVGFQIRENKGVPTEKFRFIYDRMMYEAKEKNPNAILVIMEPFVFKKDLKNVNLQFGNDLFLNYDFWRNEIEEKAAAAKGIANKYKAVFVPLANIFDEYAEKYNVEKLTNDGIHPTLIGHKLIADAWLENCMEFLSV